MLPTRSLVLILRAPFSVSERFLLLPPDEDSDLGQCHDHGKDGQRDGGRVDAGGDALALVRVLEQDAHRAPDHDWEREEYDIRYE